MMPTHPARLAFGSPRSPIVVALTCFLVVSLPPLVATPDDQPVDEKVTEAKATDEKGTDERTPQAGSTSRETSDRSSRITVSSVTGPTKRRGKPGSDSTPPKGRPKTSAVTDRSCRTTPKRAKWSRV